MSSSSTRLLSIRRKVLTAVATLTCVAGMSAAVSGTASAATPQCGPGCISVFSSVLGTPMQPNFVEAVLHGGAARVGQPVGLKPASSSDPSLDIKPLPGTVSEFYARGTRVGRGEQPVRPIGRCATGVRAVRQRDRAV